MGLDITVVKNQQDQEDLWTRLRRGLKA